MIEVKSGKVKGSMGDENEDILTIKLLYQQSDDWAVKDEFWFVQTGKA